VERVDANYAATPVLARTAGDQYELLAMGSLERTPNIAVQSSTHGEG
jgi:hypothetical protein